MPKTPARRALSLVRQLAIKLRAVGIVLFCTTGSHACGGNDAPLPRKPPPVRGVGPATPASATPNLKVTAPRPSPVALPTTPLGSANERARTDRSPREAVTEEPEAQPDQPRDYGAELRGLLGSPAACLTPRDYDSSLRPITIQIAAQLMPSGGLGRVEVRSPGLTNNELHCVQRLAAPLRLRGPIDGAPLGVQTQLTLQPQAGERTQPKAARAGDDNAPDTSGESVDPTAPEEVSESGAVHQPAQEFVEAEQAAPQADAPDDSNPDQQP